MPDPLLAALAQIVGPGHVLSEPEARAGYERDWTGRWRGDALAVVRPADTAEVAAVVSACARAGAAIVPQGGNTGLVGGGVPRASGAARRPQIVLLTTRLNAVHDVDTATAQLAAGAGTTLAAAQRAAHAAGLDLALDLAARDSATLGGLIACDAGGPRALRHGTARRQLAGLRAVLADGTVVESRMTGMLKDTAGYDLGGLLAGSEGTLAVITAVRWSLQPLRSARAVALVGVDTVADAVTLARTLRPQLPSLEVCELMQRDGIELTLAYLGASAPMAPSAVAVLLECAADEDPLAELASALDRAGVAERTVSVADAAGRQRLAAIRERHADAIAAEGVPVKFDVGVPLDRLAEFADAVDGVVDAVSADARVITFGHLADGNLHVNVLPARADLSAPGDLSAPSAPGAPPDADTLDALDDAVLGLVARCGGTVSAEHGIGVHKVRHLQLTRSASELAAMWAIKQALDPAGILNPGVGLPPRSAAGAPTWTWSSLSAPVPRSVR
jgi:FAD/FMN-containing dehydrogenase